MGCNRPEMVGTVQVMRVGLVTICFNEERFLPKFLSHIPDWVDEKIVLVSTQPWQGVNEPLDSTADIARDMGATVVENYWQTEADQRNTGQALLSDCDWVIVLDPDEFLDDKGWAELKRACETVTGEAYVVQHQRVFYKDKEVYPHTDYQQIILVKPSVQFPHARNVNRPYKELPIELLHFSWARTDEEVWSKISHYTHANEMDIESWYKNVWLADKTENLHPMTPEALKALIPAVLPLEIQELNLWP